MHKKHISYAFYSFYRPRRTLHILKTAGKYGDSCHANEEARLSLGNYFEIH